MTLRRNAQEFWQLTEGAGSILIVSHEKPDGDAISSLLAVKGMLAHLTKARIVLVSRDGVPPAFTYLANWQEIKNDFIGGDFDLILTIDCGDLRRTGFSERIEKLVRRGVKLINIDHHPKNDLHRLACINMVDLKAASTTQILYRLCLELGVPINPDLATCLFTGLYTDTGNFQHSVTTVEVLQSSSRLLAFGARFRDLNRHLTNTKSVAMLKLWGKILSQIRLASGGIVIAVVSQTALKETGASEEEVAGIVSMLESMDQCRVAILLLETADGGIRVSLRSNNSLIDVTRLARVFGGGGHPKAAGFAFPGQLQVDSTGWKVV